MRKNSNKFISNGIMRRKGLFCLNTTQCCLIYCSLIVVLIGTSTPSTPSTVTSIGVKNLNKRENTLNSTQILDNSYANTSLNIILDDYQPTTGAKSRAKRSVIQLAGMIRCVSGCDPFSYKSYGCYCGYMGAGRPVDLIDRCCLQHDWCYTHAACPQVLVYFMPYQWSCITPGYAECGFVPFGGIRERCSYELCQCDVAFAKCLSQNPCPIDKPICQSSPIIAIQNIIIG